ncbi:MAG: AAA family ATPase [Thermoflexaceae bacterium]|nr:AAA family ATPase [Thermoflexaceae bacterium]
MGAAALTALQIPATLAGRDDEVALLGALLHAARAGEPRIAVITGEAGMGKSRLARELQSLAESAAMQVAAGRFLEGGHAPNLAFADALVPRLRDALPSLPAASRDDAAAALEALTAAAPSPVAAPGAYRHDSALHRVLPGAVAALARRRPLLLVIDDLHWAEPDALQAFLHLAAGLIDLAAGGEPVPVAFVALCRPPAPDDSLAHVLERLRREPAACHVPLAGLGSIGLNDLVRETTGATCAPALLHRLQDVTGGNPLLLLETLSALAEQGALSAGDGQLAATTDPATLPLPRELSRAIAHRLEAVPGEQTRILAFAALAGDEFTPERLTLLASVPLESALETLDEALAHRFVVPAGEAFRFAHPLVRRAVADTVPPHRRAAAHAAIAARLVEAGEPSMAIAHHLLQAGSAADPHLLGLHASIAGGEALAAGAWGEAARYFEAALAAPGYAAALPPTARARLLYNSAFAHYRELDVPRMRSRFADAIDAFRECGDLRGWAESLEGWIRSAISHGALAAEALDDRPYREFMDAAGDREPHARALVMCEWAEASTPPAAPSASPSRPRHWTSPANSVTLPAPAPSSRWASPACSRSMCPRPPGTSPTPAAPPNRSTIPGSVAGRCRTSPSPSSAWAGWTRRTSAPSSSPPPRAPPTTGRSPRSPSPAGSPSPPPAATSTPPSVSPGRPAPSSPAPTTRGPARSCTPPWRRRAPRADSGPNRSTPPRSWPNRAGWRGRGRISPGPARPRARPAPFAPRSRRAPASPSGAPNPAPPSSPPSPPASTSDAHSPSPRSRNSPPSSSPPPRGAASPSFPAPGPPSRASAPRPLCCSAPPGTPANSSKPPWPECRAAGARAELARALLGLARVPGPGSPAAQSALAEGAALARELGMAPSSPKPPTSLGRTAWRSRHPPGLRPSTPAACPKPPSRCCSNSPPAATPRRLPPTSCSRRGPSAPRSRRSNGSASPPRPPPPPLLPNTALARPHHHPAAPAPPATSSSSSPTSSIPPRSSVPSATTPGPRSCSATTKFCRRRSRLPEART